MESSIETLLRQILNKHKEEMKEEMRLFLQERQFLRNEILETQNEILDKMQYINQEGKKMAEFQSSLKDKVLELEEKVDTIGTKLKENIEESVPQSTQEISSDVSKTNEEIKLIKQTVNHMKSSQDELTTFVVQQCSCTQTIKDKVEETTRELSDKLTRAKLDTFSFIEKEGQMTRDFLRPTAALPIRTRYVCDQYVEYFATLINSKGVAYSFPWYIHQLRSSVQGVVWFLSSKEMKVGLKYARNPQELGAQPRFGVKLKASASVRDTSNTLTDIGIGSDTRVWNEAEVKDNEGLCAHIGDVNCQELIDAGFANKEGYKRGAILIRYDIKVV